MVTVPLDCGAGAESSTQEKSQFSLEQYRFTSRTYKGWVRSTVFFSKLGRPTISTTIPPLRSDVSVSIGTQPSLTRDWISTATAFARPDFSNSWGNTPAIAQDVSRIVMIDNPLAQLARSSRFGNEYASGERRFALESRIFSISSSSSAAKIPHNSPARIQPIWPNGANHSDALAATAPEIAIPAGISQRIRCPSGPSSVKYELVALRKPSTLLPASPVMLSPVCQTLTPHPTHKLYATPALQAQSHPHQSTLIP
jgi:hypothetical protein